MSKNILSILLLFIGAIEVSYAKDSSHAQKTSTYIAKKIVSIIEEYTLDYDIDKCVLEGACQKVKERITGQEKLEQRILSLIREDKPLEFFLVGFPFKATNKNMVLGDLPDMAERICLEHLNELIMKICKVYPGGATLKILLDGQLIGKPLGISDKEILAFEDSMKRLASDLPGLKLITMADYVRAMSVDEMRSIAAKTLGTPFADFKNTILQKPEVLAKASKKVRLEHPNKSDVEIKHMTLELMHADEQLQALMKRMNGPDVIRFSGHYKPDISEKIGVKLSPNGKVTPWFGVMVKDKDGVETILPRTQVSLKNYELKSRKINNQTCPYYQYRKEQK